MPKGKEPTPKQKAFADEFLKCGNQTEAAKRAGYSEKTARQAGAENMKKPVVLEYIQKRQKQIEDARIEFPANEVFSGSGQPYVPTAGGAMTGDLKRNINDADYTVYSATTETTESGTSVNIEFGDVNANPFILGLSQPIWNNGVNVKKLLTEDDIYELERRINELESMDTQTFKNPYKKRQL